MRESMLVLGEWGWLQTGLDRSPATAGYQSLT
jgi:hypothetical protein